MSAPQMGTEKGKEKERVNVWVLPSPSLSHSILCHMQSIAIKANNAMNYLQEEENVRCKLETYGFDLQM